MVSQEAQLPAQHRRWQELDVALFFLCTYLHCTYTGVNSNTWHAPSVHGVNGLWQLPRVEAVPADVNLLRQRKVLLCAAGETHAV